MFPTEFINIKILLYYPAATSYIYLLQHILERKFNLLF